MLKKLFSFNGRIRRTAYGLSLIAYIVIALSLEYILLVPLLQSGKGFPLYLIILLLIICIMPAQGCQRCHDRGNSGWYQIIPFYDFGMLFADSISCKNEYGPNPKGIGNTDEVYEIGDYLKSSKGGVIKQAQHSILGVSCYC
jgi:uncharacterized membrane protein YhaH (DUF805 family)